METSEFIDLYEALEVSPNANSETIERMFRYLARRYHPDNPATADRDRFDMILKAHNTLRDAARRAAYDIEYDKHSTLRADLAEEVRDTSGVGRDIDTQKKLLSIFYAKRRKDLENPGIGDADLEHLLGCPIEHLAFNLWYMREKRWILKTENGMYAITVEGVDRIWSEALTDVDSRLITDQS